ncbi:PREDICTED: uncharacterized protein LOC107331998 isoform X2 [Acropora digitifera]|uniref:uncharacterized protein LOC107331998 isoform X2 n=1 Tax=Acropora digitifera TaxID=70779 RepID=UPI00077A0E6D|nr:PREDICTED: uncharacterized protein LOC107331998 isoform X2 [Acropora digitifera]
MASMTVDDVKSWLIENGFEEYATTFHDNDIDGEALLSLTERATEQLIPSIGHRMKFLRALHLKKDQSSGDGNIEVQTIEKQGDETAALTIMETSCSNLKECERQARKRPAVSPQAQSKNSVTLNAKRPWPSTLVLPSNCRQDVTRALSSGEKLCKKQRMSFIRSLYDHFSLYTLYPTRDQLTAVAHLIIQTYPALKDQSVGTGYVKKLK